MTLPRTAAPAAMSRRDFYQHCEQYFADQKDILTAKGADYADDDDAFENINLIAQITRLPPALVACVLKLKHELSIVRYARTGAATAEPIEGRLIDSSNYNLMIAGIERGQKSKTKETK